MNSLSHIKSLSDVNSEATPFPEDVSYSLYESNWKSSKKPDYEYEFKGIFRGRDKTIYLKRAVPCYFYFEDDELMGECPIFGFISTGSTRKEILENFDLEFEFLYANYVQEKDSKLTKKAVVLKEYLKGWIDKIIQE